MFHANTGKYPLLVTCLILAYLLAGCGSSPPASPSEENPALDQRLDRIEELLEGRERSAMADMHNELQQLQAEIRQLRGKIETQQQNIEVLSRDLEQTKQAWNDDMRDLGISSEYQR